MLDVALQHQSALVQQRQLVAHVLQLPQRVGGDDRRSATVQHFLANQTLDIVPHHRIQSVKRLVKEQVVRMCG